MLLMKETKSSESGNIKKLNAVKKKKKKKKTTVRKCFWHFWRGVFKPFSETPQLLKFNAWFTFTISYEIFMTWNVNSLKTDHVHNLKRLTPFIVLDS